jgi:formate hydrogenlyase subunit 3/multisubunit Na+/H+ antiporter MnhD subunit
MSPFLYAICIITVSALGALLTSRWSRLSSLVGCTGAVIGSAFGFIDALKAIWLGSNLSIQLDWSIPFGSFFITIDPLSAVFLLPVFTLCGVAAIFGHGYLEGYAWRKNLGVVWFFYNTLIVSMALVIVARNAVLFLIAWEIMSVASFFLVTFDHEDKSARRAGWIYLVATHIGTAFLLAFFILMGKASGSLDFNTIPPVATSTANLLFLLALVGFGTKAGFMPMHFWLPEAHPAAPSHVSAVMSGVMIKTGIYGIIRTIILLQHPPLWWGTVLIAIGLASGILGVLLALAQHDLKRLLAYHSVENIGIIALGIGVGLVGMSTGMNTVAALGFGGAILHVFNHAMFKGLLFLGAGSVMHAVGTRNIEELGGLLKRMPWTGTTFLVGAIAICGLPPLNGFISEMLIFLGAYHSLLGTNATAIALSLAVIAGLALIGGLAAACFTKAFGIVFLGEPRSQHAAIAHESGPTMLWPMGMLAAACAAIGLFSPFVIRVMLEALAQITAAPRVAVVQAMVTGRSIMICVVSVTVVLIIFFVLLLVLRRILLAGRKVTMSVTWDCGYAAPTPRMQYTASSFAGPLVELFRGLLRPHEEKVLPQGMFPKTASYSSHTPDLLRAGPLSPIIARLRLWASRFLWLQHGKVQLYVLYIAITLLILLIWKLS